MYTHTHTHMCVYVCVCLCVMCANCIFCASSVSLWLCVTLCFCFFHFCHVAYFDFDSLTHATTKFERTHTLSAPFPLRPPVWRLNCLLTKVKFCVFFGFPFGVYCQPDCLPGFPLAWCFGGQQLNECNNWLWVSSLRVNVVCRRL